MTLAATLQPATGRHGRTVAVAHAGMSPAEHLAGLLDAIVLDGNVRAMEALACLLVRAGACMQALADAMLSGEQRTRRLPLTGGRSHRMAERTARRALAGAICDPAPGADCFHRYGDLPAWTAAARPVAHLGELVFYRAAPGTMAVGGGG